jgi:hypothetical protein
MSFNFGDIVTFDLDPSDELLMVVVSGQRRTKVANTDGVEIFHATELLTRVIDLSVENSYAEMMDYYAKRDNDS